MENMQPHIKENKIHHKRIPKNVGSQKYVQSLKIMRGITFSFKTIFQKSKSATEHRRHSYLFQEKS